MWTTDPALRRRLVSLPVLLLLLLYDEEPLAGSFTPRHVFRFMFMFMFMFIHPPNVRRGQRVQHLSWTLKKLRCTA